MKINSLVWADAIIGSIREKPQDSASIVRNFLKKLTSQRQNKLLPAILRQIKKVENKNTINVTSGFDLSPEAQLIVKQSAQKLFPEIQNPAFNFTVNSEIVGGIKINFQDKEYDASLARNIDKIKEQLWR